MSRLNIPIPVAFTNKEQADLFRTCVGYKSRIERIESENAKLRELAKAAWGCVNRHVSCDECRMVFCGCTLQSAMRELGIEVKDD